MDIGLLPFELGHAHLHGGLIHAVLDRGHDAVDGSLNLWELLAVGMGLGPSRMIVAVHFLVIGAHRLGDGFCVRSLPQMWAARSPHALPERAPSRSGSEAGL